MFWWRLTRIRLIQLLVTVLLTLFYNEYMVYYLVLGQCSWPSLKTMAQNHEVKTLKAMFLADPHLLGPTGHWWDRLRREWQMERAFQTAIHLHHPEVVFILGDLFDDGKWSQDSDFLRDVKRYYKIFRHPPDIKLVPLVGNHDIGFHYMADEHKLRRFVRATNSSDSLQLLEMSGVIFVTANSVAFEGDKCSMCSKAEKQLNNISSILNCNRKKDTVNAECKIKIKYSSPILLQHYPMYRQSDSECTGVDAAPLSDRSEPFRLKYDCLSPEASNKLMSGIEPRLIISGHTHHHCIKIHKNNVPEYSVPSFSWRNKKNPSFLMVSITPDEYSVDKCWMPDENTVINVYGLVIALLATYILVITVIYCTKLCTKPTNPKRL